MRLQTNRRWRFQCAAAVTLLLSACGGGGGGTTDRSTDVPPLIAQSASNTMLTAFDGRTLPARAVSLRDSGEHNSIQSASSYSYNSATEELSLTIGDTSRTIVISSGNPDISFSDNFVSSTGPYTVFWTPLDGTLNEYLNGLAPNKFAVPVVSYLQSADRQFIDRNYGIIGFETPSEFLQASTSTATYSGSFLTDTYERFTTEINSVNLSGVFSLGVDFGSSMLTGGTLSLITEYTDAAGSIERNGEISIGPATIDSSANAFQASLNSSAPGLILDSNAMLEGGFYGNTAQEVGGSISYTGTLDGTSVLAAGVIIGTKD